MLHLNANTAYDEEDADLLWMRRHPRVELSCLRVGVSPWSGSLFAAQAAALAWAQCQGWSAESDHHVELGSTMFRGAKALRSVVFQASTMWWVRQGMEDFVHEHRQSMPLISTAHECARFQLAAYARTTPFDTSQGCYILPRARKANVAFGCPQASCIKNTQPVQGPGCCSYMVGGKYFNTIPDACLVPPFRLSRTVEGQYGVVTLTKHEGSFYPATLAYAVVDALRDVQPEDVHNAADRTMCPAANHTLFRVTEWGLDAHFFMEEIMFQTFAANGFLPVRMSAPRHASRLDAKLLAAILDRDAYAHSNVGVECMRLAQMLRREGRNKFAIKLHALREPTFMGQQRRQLVSCLAHMNLTDVQ